jgi:hypothetical protein
MSAVCLYDELSSPDRYPRYQGVRCWIAGRRHACLGGSIQNHKNKDSLYRRKSLESGRIGRIVYKYRASPTVRSIDFIIQCTIPKVPLLKLL